MCDPSDKALRSAILTIFLITSVAAAFCQVTEKTDSILRDSVKVARPVYHTPGWVPLSLLLNPNFGYSTSTQTTQPLQINRSFIPKAIRPGQIAAWQNGRLTGFVSTETMPGMMGIERGGFSVGQNIGDFSFNVYGEAIKYGFYRDLRKSLGYGGSVSYQVNDRVSVTMFGNYYTSPGGMHPAMAGYVSIPSFGGFADYRINSRWGVQVGAQSYRSMATQRWETQPIVMPYFRLSKKNIIGVDLGGILYQVIRTVNDRRHRENPTLPPPVAPLPPLSR